ncbi:HAD family phosphatase [Salinibacterium sp. SWN1162]|uniref:HAD family hydrolase n=1 Tax=Salinibacterium sp. SWN1162 TaxID=2792053 RepID=UPI0027DB8DDF|nr:HAD family phosphatase [Salinibacterium sp. SWN1162]
MTHSTPAAVLWDMDGTLINSEPYWISAEIKVVESFGGEWTHEDAMSCVGNGLLESARVMQAKGVTLDAQDIVDQLTDSVMAQLKESGIPWRPGARELLTELREAGVPTALVTMSIGRMAQHVVENLGFHGFDAVVTGDDVEHAKPHPQPYRQGAAALGVDITDCVAIEDSPPGASSAHAAGATVIGVPFMVDIPEEKTHALWPTLDGRTLDHLSELHAKVTTR